MREELALAETPEDPEAALARDEDAMFARSERAAVEAACNMALCSGPDAARRLAGRMRLYLAAAGG